MRYFAMANNVTKSHQIAPQKITSCHILKRLSISGDDASPGHWDEQTSDNWFATWNVTYASKIKYEEREYKTTVRVYYSGLFGRDFLGEKVVKYRVTKNLNGDLVFEQKGPAVIGHDNIIRSTENTELSVKFHDPSGEQVFVVIIANYIKKFWY